MLQSQGRRSQVDWAQLSLSQADWERKCKKYLPFHTKRRNGLKAERDMTSVSLFPIHPETLADARSTLEYSDPDDIISTLTAGTCVGLSYLWAVFFFFNQSELWKQLLSCMGKWDGLEESLSVPIHEGRPYTLYQLFAESIGLIEFITGQFIKQHANNLFTAKSKQFKLKHKSQTYSLQHDVCYAGDLTKKDIANIMDATHQSGLLFITNGGHMTAAYIQRSASGSTFIFCDPTMPLVNMVMRNAEQFANQIFSRLNNTLGIQFMSVGQGELAFKNKHNTLAQHHWLNHFGLSIIAEFSPYTLPAFFKMVKTDAQKEQMVNALCQRHPLTGWLTLTCIMYNAPNEAGAWLQLAETDQQKNKLLSPCVLYNHQTTRENY